MSYNTQEYSGLEEKLIEENTSMKKSIEEIKKDVDDIRFLAKRSPFTPIGQGLVTIVMVAAVFVAKSLFDAHWAFLIFITMIFLGIIENIGGEK
jgi:hypothetical protein